MSARTSRSSGTISDRPESASATIRSKAATFPSTAFAVTSLASLASASTRASRR